MPATDGARTFTTFDVDRLNDAIAGPYRIPDHPCELHKLSAECRSTESDLRALGDRIQAAAESDDRAAFYGGPGAPRTLPDVQFSIERRPNEPSPMNYMAKNERPLVALRELFSVREKMEATFEEDLKMVNATLCLLWYGPKRAREAYIEAGVLAKDYPHRIVTETVLVEHPDRPIKLKAKVARRLLEANSQWFRSLSPEEMKRHARWLFESRRRRTINKLARNVGKEFISAADRVAALGRLADNKLSGMLPLVHEIIKSRATVDVEIVRTSKPSGKAFAITKANGQSIRKADVNVKMMRMKRSNPVQFNRMSVADFARLFGCSKGTVHSTDAWKLHPKCGSGKRKRAVRLSGAAEDAAAWSAWIDQSADDERDLALDLLKQQQADRFSERRPLRTMP